MNDMKHISRNIKFPLTPFTVGHLAGSRTQAIPLRDAIEEAYRVNSVDIVLDFNGVEVTQSFMDEVIGKLILIYGPEILERVVFKNCSENVQAIIRFVASDRADQFLKKHAH